MADSNVRRIAIVTNYKGDYSETFIQAHIDRLANLVIYSHQFPKNAEEMYPVNDRMRKSDYRINQLKRWFRNNLLNRGERAKVVRLLKENKIQVVLAEYGTVAAKIFPLIKELGIPLVVHFHGSDAYKHKHLQKYGTIYQSMFKYTQAVIAVSVDMQQQLIQLGASPERVYHNVYGIDLNKFTTTTNQYDSQRILMVGRFVEKKAPYLCLLAFQRVLGQFPRAKLVLVGDGELLDICQRIATALKMEDSVEFLGAIPHQAVRKEMQRASFFIQHSIVAPNGDSEGTPNTILEAGAMGLPIVSTQHAGIKDVVVHGETGYLVEEGDMIGMADYMSKLLSDIRFIAEMGQQGRKRMIAHYGMERSIERLTEILQKASETNVTD